MAARSPLISSRPAPLRRPGRYSTGLADFGNLLAPCLDTKLCRSAAVAMLELSIERRQVFETPSECKFRYGMVPIGRSKQLQAYAIDPLCNYIGTESGSGTGKELVDVARRYACMLGRSSGR